MLAKFRPTTINTDLPPEAVGPEAWTFAKNVIMGDQETSSALGAMRIWGTPLARPIWGQAVPLVNPRVQYASASALYATDGISHTDITPAGGFGVQNHSAGTGGMFNGLAVANDGARAPCYWGGALASLALSLPGWPVGDRCVSMRPFKYFLVAAGGIHNGVDAPYTVRWSVSAAPGSPPSTWVPATTNDAGAVTLAGAREPLVDMAPLKDGLLIFEPHSTWLLQYLGGAFTFQNRRIFSTVGLLAPNAWVALGAEAVWVADGDILISDGNQTRSLVKQRVQKAMFAALNAEARKNVWATASVTRKQIIIGFPSGASTYANKALIWNYADDKWGMIDLPDYAFGFQALQIGIVPTSWDTEPGTWDSELAPWDYGGFRSSDSYIVGLRPDYNTAGAFEATSTAESPPDGPLECIARKEKILLDKPDRMKQITRLYPQVHAPDGVELFWRVGAAREPGQPTSWGPEVPFMTGQDHKVDVRQTGRYVSVQVRSLTARRWSIAGFDLEYQDAGAR